MDDLIAFVGARLDEAAAGAWSVHDVARCDALLYEEDMPAAAADTPDCDCGYPARVLREVEAWRAVVARHVPVPVRGVDAKSCRYCRRICPCPDVRSMAAVYGDHPDYRPEWKP